MQNYPEPRPLERNSWLLIMVKSLADGFDHCVDVFPWSSAMNFLERAILPIPKTCVDVKLNLENNIHAKTKSLRRKR